MGNRGITSIPVDYVEGILGRLSEKFIDTTTGVSKKKIPINILSDIPAEGAEGLTLTTQDVVELFVDTQLFFLFKDEYFAGFPCNTPEEFYYAVDFILRSLGNRCYDEYYTIQNDNIVLVRDNFNINNLSLQKHPMRILAKTCVSTAEEGNEMMTYNISYTHLITGSTKMLNGVVGSRDLSDVIKLITQSNIFKLNQILQDGSTDNAIVNGNITSGGIQAINFEII